MGLPLGFKPSALEPIESTIETPRIHGLYEVILGFPFRVCESVKGSFCKTEIERRGSNRLTSSEYMSHPTYYQALKSGLNYDRFDKKQKSFQLGNTLCSVSLRV